MKSLRQLIKSVQIYFSWRVIKANMQERKIQDQLCAHHVMEDRNVLNKDTSYGRKRRKRPMVSTYIFFEHFLRTFKKRARDMRNNYNNKLIDIYHDQDVLVIHSIW